MTTTLANEAFRVEGENVAMLAAGAARDELQVERVILRIQANPDPPLAAAADFDLVRLVNGPKWAATAGPSHSNSPFWTRLIPS